MSRVYYSAFSPIPDASRRLPIVAPPLQRESRLYQSDWLLRYYGFTVDELLPSEQPHLALHIDPKLAWAFAHPEFFPVDVNRAAREVLLRVPGFGRKTVDRIVRARRLRSIRSDDIKRLGVSPAKALPFIVLPDLRPADGAMAALNARTTARIAASRTQLDLFA